MSVFTKFAEELTPIVKGMFSSIAKDGIPLARSVASNAVNNLPGFYGGTVPRIKAYSKGLFTTSKNMAAEQFNPVTRKLRDQYGISKTTQDVAKKTVKTLEGKKGKDIQARKKEIIKLNKNITRATNQGDEVKVNSLSKELESIKPVTDKEAALISKAGKEAQGQLSYQFMQNEMQGTSSSILTQKFMDENYLDVLPLSKENYVDIQDFKYWEMDRFTNPNDVMSTAFDRIQNAWGKSLNVDDAIMFVKKTSASDASANLASEVSRGAVVDSLIKKVLNQKPIKKFNTAEEMAEYLTTELNKKSNWRPVSKLNKTRVSKAPTFEIKDGMLWYGESFNSSAYELGGVNLQSGIMPDGNVVQFLSDVQDLGKMRMPAGQDGLSVSLPLVKNYYKKKSVVPAEEKAYLAAQKILKKQRAGLFEGSTDALGGMSANQTALVKEIAELKPDALTVEEWITYLSKMGIGASVVTPMAGGLLTSQER